MSGFKSIGKKPNLDEWNLKSIKDFMSLVNDVALEAAGETLNYIVSEKYDSYLHLPYMWAPDSDGDGGPAVKDPLTIHVCLGYDYLDANFEFNLTAQVHDFIYSQISNVERAPDKWYLEPDAQEKIQTMAKAFQTTADILKESAAGDFSNVRVK